MKATSCSLMSLLSWNFKSLTQRLWFHQFDHPWFWIPQLLRVAHCYIVVSLILLVVAMPGASTSVLAPIRPFAPLMRFMLRTFPSAQVEDHSTSTISKRQRLLSRTGLPIYSELRTFPKTNQHGLNMVKALQWSLQSYKHSLTWKP